MAVSRIMRAAVGIAAAALLSTAILAAGPGGAGAAARCTRTLAPGGDVGLFVASLGPGDTGCLQSGATFNGGVNLSHGGTASAPLTVTSTDPANPATVFGRVVTHPGAGYVTFTHLNLDWDSGGSNLPSITLASDHVSLTYDDIQNGNTSICVNLLADEVWGTARSTLIDHDRIHNCGVRPVTRYTSAGYYSHALYVSGVAARITNNYIYGTSGKGILLRGSVGAYVANNTIDDNGAGIAFGDLSASTNVVTRNIVTNSNAGCACNAYGVFAWWGETPVGTGNTFHDNCVHGNQDGDVNSSAGGFTAADSKTADPLYLDGAAHDYTLSPSSPCLGYGPDTAQPGASAGGGRDTSPPSIPTGLEALGGDQSSIRLTWAASRDDVGVVGYDVYDGSAIAGSTVSPGIRLMGLSCGTSHVLQVSVYDAAGNRSARSAAQTAEVLPCSSSAPGAVAQSVVDGAIVSGSIVWSARLTGPAASISRMDFLVDGALYHSELAAPYGAPCDACTFDTTRLADGIHRFAVEARFPDGSTATSSASVTVVNEPEHQMVTESLGDGSGAPLSGSVSWSAWPTAPRSTVSWVYFFLDGALYHAEQSPPYGAPCDGCSFDTTSIANGSHDFTVLAVWADGSTAVATRALAVANGASTRVPW